MPKKDWIEDLERTDRESARKLNELLSIVARHKRIYAESKDPAIAQLWLAVLEIYSRQERISREIIKLSRNADLDFEHSKESSRVLDILKRRKENENQKSSILESLDNY